MVFFHSNALLNSDLPAGKRIWLNPAFDQRVAIETIINDVNPAETGIWLEAGLQAAELEAATTELPSPTIPPLPCPQRIAFFAASDTLAFSQSPIIKRLRQKQDLELKIYHRLYPDEKALEGFRENQIESERFSFWKLLQFQPDYLLFGNDWTADSQLMIALGRIFGFRTICLQESVIDLADQSRDRMLWADIAFVQGAKAVYQLRRSTTFVTGNPRYESLAVQLPNTEHQPHFLINCNFTYGVFEDQRLHWLRPIVRALEELGASYQIAQHPRDRGNLSEFSNVVASNAGNIQGIIAKADCIISRFSSVIHEGILQGKRVVYYNPHGESVGYDYGFDQKILFYATNENELYESISAIQTQKLSLEAINDYLSRNLNVGLGVPSQLITDLLSNLQVRERDGKSIFLPLAIYSALKLYLTARRKQSRKQ